MSGGTAAAAAPARLATRSSLRATFMRRLTSAATW